MKKVKGHPTLVRDENSRAIVNKDKTGLQAARAVKKAKMEQIRREQALEKRVQKLEHMLEDILKKLNSEG